MADVVPGTGMGALPPDIEGFRQQLRWARYFAGQGDMEQARRRFSEAMAQYASNPGRYAGYQDEVDWTREVVEGPDSARAEAAASASMIQQRGANSRPSGSGNVWIDTLLNVPGAVAERADEIASGNVWSDEQCRVLGMRKDDATGRCAPHPTGWLPNLPNLPGCSSLPGPLAWACENPGKTAAIGAGLVGLWVFGPMILGKGVQTWRALA